MFLLALNLGYLDCVEFIVHCVYPAFCVCVCVCFTPSSIPNTQLVQPCNVLLLMTMEVVVGMCAVG